MSSRPSIRLFVFASLALSLLLSPAINPPSAAAAPCPDVQIVFARGTFEPPGVGGVGQAFVDSLTSKVGGKSVDVYPVNYPASLDFATAADGVIDARSKVENVATTCPDTKIVLGGFSQGAAVAGYITADAVPPGFTLPQGITGPMPSEVADHVAAVALFGKPSNGFLQIDQHRRAADHGRQPLFAEDARPVHSRGSDLSPGGGDNGAHNLYPVSGMTDQAATFAAQHVSAPNSASSH